MKTWCSRRPCQAPVGAGLSAPSSLPAPQPPISLRFIFSSEPKDQTFGEQSQMELAVVMNRTSGGPLPWP